MTIDIQETLMEAIKNASERGYDIATTRDSLVNAGYNKDEVDLACQKVKGELPSPIGQNGRLDEGLQEIQKEVPQNKIDSNPAKVVVVSQKKPKKSNSLTIVLIILSLLILAIIGGFLIWIYRDSIMQFFS